MLGSVGGNEWPLLAYGLGAKLERILMLCKVVECGQIKCHQYWPKGNEEDNDYELTYTDVDLKIEFLAEIKSQHFITRRLKLTDLKVNHNYSDFIH